MEALLNLGWLAISVSLAAYWIAGLTLAKGERYRYSTLRMQLLALAMLIIVLLPVISMTDDLQAMQMAEVEHVTRRADLLPNSDQLADLIVSLDIRVFLGVDPANLQVFARLTTFFEAVLLQNGYSQQLSNRPPPVAA